TSMTAQGRNRTACPMLRQWVQGPTRPPAKNRRRGSPLHSHKRGRILQKQPDLEGLMRVPRMTAAKRSFSSYLSRHCARAALAVVGGLVCAGVPRAAGAHIKMSAPADWIMTNASGDPQKITPCGVDPTMPSTYTVTNAVTTVHPGDQVTVKWTE